MSSAAELWVSQPVEIRSTPDAATVGGLGGDAAGRLGNHPAGRHRDGLPQVFHGHVVEQDGIQADLQRLFELRQRVDLDLDLDEVAGMRFCPLDRGADIAGDAMWLSLIRTASSRPKR